MRLHWLRPSPHWQHAGRVSGLVCDAEGKRALVWGPEALRLLDLYRGRPLFTWPCQPLTASFGPERSQMLCAEKERCWAWDLELGRMVSEFDYEWTIEARFCGDRLITAKYKNLEVRDLATGSCLTQWPLAYEIQGLATHPRGRLAALDWMGLELLDPAEGRLWRAESGHLSQGVFSPDGSLLLTVGFSGGLGLWEVDTGRELATATERVRAAAFSPDGQRLLVSYEDATIRMLEVPSLASLGQCATEFHLTALAWPSEKPARAVTGNAYGGIARWDLDSWRQLSGFAAGSVTAAALVGSRALVARAHDRQLEVRDLESQAELDTWWSSAEHLAVTPDGAHVLAAGHTQVVLHRRDGRCRELQEAFWEMDSGSTVISCVALSPDARVAAACDRMNLIVWDFNRGREKRRRDVGGYRDALLLAEGRLLLADIQRGVVEVWDLDLEKLQSYQPMQSATRAALSPDGGRVAYTGSRFLTVCNLDGKAERSVNVGSPATALAFSPDGRRVVCACPNSLVVWTPRSGRTRALELPTPPSCLAASDRVVLVGFHDGAVAVVRP